jgi:hypothetical protein
MRRLRFAALIAASLLTVPSIADAFQPTLRNQDSKSYKYQIVCGGSTVHSTISANSSTTLSSGPNCKLKVEGAGATKLADDLKCTIKNGMLDCD